MKLLLSNKFNNHFNFDLQKKTAIATPIPDPLEYAFVKFATQQIQLLYDVLNNVAFTLTDNICLE